jgi:Fe-S-cluster containining protein
MKKNDQIIARVSEIYNWIEARQLANNGFAGQCAACGKCCDFQQYDHRLYVTTPEIIFFVEKLGLANLKQMTTARCCYQVKGKCGVHAYRFSGCRIFCCKGKATFQSELTEAAIKKFKALCAELQIPYQYVELSAALKSVVAAERPSAGSTSSPQASSGQAAENARQ